MDIKHLSEFTSKSIDAHGSRGAEISHLITPDKSFSLVWLHLLPGGKLGMHEAADDQLFIVVRGSGFARVEGFEPHRIREGSLVIWQKGEKHETAAGSKGITAIIIELISSNYENRLH